MDSAVVSTSELSLTEKLPPLIATFCLSRAAALNSNAVVVPSVTRTLSLSLAAELRALIVNFSAEVAG